MLTIYFTQLTVDGMCGSWIVYLCPDWWQQSGKPCVVRVWSCWLWLFSDCLFICSHHPHCCQCLGCNCGFLWLLWCHKGEQVYAGNLLCHNPGPLYWHDSGSCLWIHSRFGIQFFVTLNCTNLLWKFLHSTNASELCLWTF